MQTDPIAEQISWLDDLITRPANANLFEAKNLLAIHKELSSRWEKENRLALLNALADQFGQEEVLRVIDQIIFTNLKNDWRGVGAEKGNSFENFLEILWKPLLDEGFEYTYKTEGNKTRFCVTKCPNHEIAKKMGAEKWLYHLVCLTDEPAIMGFNDKVTFSRTRTLMQGHTDCDHCYADHS
ncbi:MAG: L-2-amino-thiazoline-4-carboxylic acid hydrolase [Anaerolineaceae bacterium]|nr:L-2-amino-thiazoline-4-carboxylic acid hydrolase [Anaerolineaceae bacterium]